MQSDVYMGILGREKERWVGCLDQACHFLDQPEKRTDGYYIETKCRDRSHGSERKPGRKVMDGGQ